MEYLGGAVQYIGWPVLAYIMTYMGERGAARRLKYFSLSAVSVEVEGPPSPTHLAT